MSDEQKAEWYTNKELYEMMVVLSKGLEGTNKELEKTQVLIRDYNGLREKINQVETDMKAKRDLRWWAMFIIAAAAVVVACVK